MVQRYSRRTLAELARFIAYTFKGYDMDVLFYSVSVPRELNQGSGKLQRAFSVISTLAEEPKFEVTLEELIREVIAQRKYLFEKYSYEESTHALLRALRAGSYEVRDGTLVPADSLETELVQETSILYERLQARDMQDVVNNLEQVHENFIDGNCEACNAMLRTGLESTFEHLAKHFAGNLDDIPRANPKYRTPADVRRYLSACGFLSPDERTCIDALYGFASPGGSHPGMSSEAESRLRRLMIVAWIQYCLEKLISQA